MSSDKKSIYKLQHGQCWNQIQQLAEEQYSNVSTTAPKVNVQETAVDEKKEQIDHAASLIWESEGIGRPMGIVIGKNSNWEPPEDDNDKMLDYFVHIENFNESINAFDDAEYSMLISNFTSNQRHQRDIFIQKNAKYGASNILEGDCANPNDVKESLWGLYFRMKDKLNRFKNMINATDSIDESIVDTLHDLANYANISIIVKNGQWKNDKDT
jgi:hypothetical protein